MRKGYYDYEDNASVLWVGQMQSVAFREVMNHQGEVWAWNWCRHADARVESSCDRPWCGSA